MDLSARNPPLYAMMMFYYCPTCARVYYLPQEAAYLCAKNHVIATWSDGVKRKYVISDRAETDKPPWPIPDLVEEKEMTHQEWFESWLVSCPYPTDADTGMGDRRRHFGFGTIGGKHLTRQQVVDKFGDYVLRAASET
jgi:hypothetical protein